MADVTYGLSLWSSAVFKAPQLPGGGLQSLKGPQASGKNFGDDLKLQLFDPGDFLI